MTLQPTASKSHLLVGDPDPLTGISPGGCARPFSPGVDTSHDEPGEPARYGSALHELLYLGLGGNLSVDLAGRIAVKWGLTFDASAELLPHAERCVALLNEWMSGANPWRVQFSIYGAEKHLALYVSSKGQARARETAFDEETHTYELASREIGSTYDLVLLGERGHIVVLDYKTGSGDLEDYTSPSMLPQMRTLALATGANIVAILHASRTAPAVIYAEQMPQTILTHHAKMLAQARRRFGDGSMRPDSYCRYCPARAGCPAFDGDLIKNAAALVKTVVAHPLAENVDPGTFHMYLTEVEKLTRRGREALRERVKRGEIIQRPDGKVLVMRHKTVEGLSKSSIERALGKVAAEKEIDRLRKLGAVEVSEREEMHAVKDE